MGLAGASAAAMAAAGAYAVSALAKTPSFCAQYRSANFSIIRSIFCASPGSQKWPRNLRSAAAKESAPKSIESTYA